MNTIEMKEYQFNSWVPKKKVSIPFILGLGFLTAGVYHWLFMVVAAILILVAGYFHISRWIFSPDGKNVQSKILDNIGSQISWNGIGSVLDIGCGNGQLIIKLAEKFPLAKFTGMDTWRENRDYSAGICQVNMELAGISERTTFQSGSAASLPFADETFDLVVSNFTYHEVMDARDKTIYLREALRVLKPGGMFVFQDLFLVASVFGAEDVLIEKIKMWGARDVSLTSTHNSSFIPGWVKLPFMVGTIAVLVGIK